MIDKVNIEPVEEYTSKQMATVGNVVSSLRKLDEKVSTFIDNYDLSKNGESFNTDTTESKVIRGRLHTTGLEGDLTVNPKANVIFNVKNNGEKSLALKLDKENGSLEDYPTVDSNKYVLTESQVCDLLYNNTESILNFIGKQTPIIKSFTVDYDEEKEELNPNLEFWGKEGNNKVFGEGDFSIGYTYTIGDTTTIYTPNENPYVESIIEYLKVSNFNETNNVGIKLSVKKNNTDTNFNVEKNISITPYVKSFDYNGIVFNDGVEDTEIENKYNITIIDSENNEISDINTYIENGKINNVGEGMITKTITSVLKYNETEVKDISNEIEIYPYVKSFDYNGIVFNDEYSEDTEIENKYNITILDSENNKISDINTYIENIKINNIGEDKVTETITSVLKYNETEIKVISNEIEIYPYVKSFDYNGIEFNDEYSEDTEIENKYNITIFDSGNNEISDIDTYIENVKINNVGEDKVTETITSILKYNETEVKVISNEIEVSPYVKSFDYNGIVFNDGVEDTVKEKYTYIITDNEGGSFDNIDIYLDSFNDDDLIGEDNIIKTITSVLKYDGVDVNTITSSINLAELLK